MASALALSSQTLDLGTRIVRLVVALPKQLKSVSGPGREIDPAVLIPSVYIMRFVVQTDYC